jgi:DNA processing protein
MEESMSTMPPARDSIAAIGALDPHGAERAARAYLLRVAEPPAPALVAFVAEVGPIEAAERVRCGEVDAPVAAEVAVDRAPQAAMYDFEVAALSGARLVIPEDGEWPAEVLAPLDAPGVEPGVGGTPLGLWVRGTGELDVLLRRAVAVVGSRAATIYGCERSADLGYHLAQSAVTVVSAAAFGVDGKAHKGAIEAGGTTVAVLPCGVEINYPVGNGELIAQVAASGLVVSEYPPGALPDRTRFLARNRLVACFGAGTVVVEASARSSARHTARVARVLGREAMAVPGPVTSLQSAGCHELVRSGAAVLVTSAAEVLETSGLAG